MYGRKTVYPNGGKTRSRIFQGLRQKANDSGCNRLAVRRRACLSFVVHHAECDRRDDYGADRHCRKRDDDNQRPKQYVGGGSDSEHDPLCEKSEGLPVPIR